MDRFSVFLVVFALHVSGRVMGEHVTSRGQRQTVAKPSGFLSATATAELHDELHQAIREALGASNTSQRFNIVREAVRPMWMSLAKNLEGRVDRRSLRYAVHRHMMKTRHISVLGLEPLQQGNGSTESVLLTDHVPAYVRTFLTGSDQSARVGFSLDDVVAMVVMLEELMVHQGHETLKQLYQSEKLDMDSSGNREHLFAVMEKYLIRWMLGNDHETIQILEGDPALLQDSFDDWTSLRHYVRGAVHAFEYEGWQAPASRLGKLGKWDPLGRRFSFEDAQMITGRMALSFGSFWHSECVRVKASLQLFDRSSTGRVTLSDFHGAALGGEWRFSESADYLSKLGALDNTSSALGPRVIIANYLQGASNCIITDKHFRVCCSNDCEAHLAQIEGALQAPVATPAQLLEIISNITIGLDDDVASVSPTLQAQLQDIASIHHGHVPLHGRLFAQFLHYVFPRDCPFPHKAGTVSSMSPLEYGDDYMASDNEIERNAALEQPNVSAANTSLEANADDAIASQKRDSIWMTQWSKDEELLTEHIQLHAPWERQATPQLSLLGVLALSAIGVAAVFLKGVRPPSLNKPFGKCHSSAWPPACDWSGKAHYV
jgi:hypothetical protein